jgi:hypothetical protein
MKTRCALVAAIAIALSCVPSASRQQSTTAPPVITEASVRGHMEFLASDAMKGRGSGTEDEWRAAVYIGSQMRRWGLEPLGDNGGFVKKIDTSGMPGSTKPGMTSNALGQLTGSDPALAKEVILLTAHLDHLGVRGSGADTIFNGADDDASGSTAVLELAEAIAAGPRPKRTVMFVWFGSEETTGFGAADFLKNPPVPLDRIIANIEFEMIANRDAAVPPHTLWLTGYERSDLGPELAKQGARIVADPHLDARFFERSDNIQLACMGIIAQTVSSFDNKGATYHKVTDDVAHVDFAHMTDAIQSMLNPVLWLANSSFKPEWLPGKKPIPGQPPCG